MAPRHLDPLQPTLSEKIAAEIRKRLRRPVNTLAATVVVGGLVGVGLFPVAGDDAASQAQPGASGLAVTGATAAGAPTTAPQSQPAPAPAPAPGPPPAPAPVPAPAPEPPAPEPVAAPAPAPAPSAVLPVDDYVLTSGFGPRWGVLHEGIDFAAPLGTPEKAVMDGVVVKAGPASGFGLAVYIQHADGDVTVYGHMRTILVKVGEQVAAGQVIAEMGSEGQSTGSHLHFEVHVGGIAGPRVDPIPWLAARGLAP